MPLAPIVLLNHEATSVTLGVGICTTKGRWWTTGPMSYFGIHAK
jgi:hypothetical protein